MKLNLGCGPKMWEGFTNVDLPGNWSGRQPDVAADITKPLPFGDGSADEIHSVHVIEHFYRWQVDDILADWVRVLKPGGLLVLECPCLDKILGHYFQAVQERRHANGRMTILGLFGDPEYRSVEMTHKWCYTAAELKFVLERLGLAVALAEPQFHQPARDMRLEARKPPAA